MVKKGLGLWLFITGVILLVTALFLLMFCPKNLITGGPICSEYVLILLMILGVIYSLIGILLWKI
ncbi:MAG: hypothetical protein ACFFFB_22600 [Candidatus Heimdallarchaeota archaeon]